MSVCRECELIEIEPGKWYYIVEDTHAPINAWDWRENAQAFGPFATEDAAHHDLRNGMLPNPGGMGVQTYQKERKVDEIEQNLIKNAKRSSRGMGYLG